MHGMTVSEKSETRAYALLTSRTSHILTKLVREQRPASAEEKKILSAAVDLLKGFVTGSRLVEGDDFKDELIAAPESMAHLRQAISTLNAMGQIGKQKPFHKAFRMLQTQLDEIAHSNTQTDPKDIKQLIVVFTGLSDQLHDEIVSTRFDQSESTLKTARSSRRESSSSSTSR